MIIGDDDPVICSSLQVADVAQAVVNAVNNDESIGQTFELTG